MTFERAIRSNVTFINLPSDMIQTAIIGRDVDPVDEYTAEGLKNLELISADLYLEMAMQPNVTEGGLSVSYDAGILKQRARNIYLRYDDPKLSDSGYRTLDLNITKA